MIYAPRIRSGGGWVLLRDLAKVAGPNCFFVVDSRLNSEQRMSFVQTEKYQIAVERTDLKTGAAFADFWSFEGFSSIIGDYKLKRLAKSFDYVLCLSNVAPLFALNRPTFVYVQNRYVIESPANITKSFSTSLKQFWFKLTANNATEFVVQSESMRRLLAEKIDAGELRSSAQISVRPFRECSPDKPISNAISAKKKWDFLYVASAEPHKNHKRLLQAWRILAAKGVFPSLALTITKADAEKLGLGFELTEPNMKIDLLGEITRQEVLDAYQQTRFYLQASFFESFGLPLLEANSFGLPIVASELDYVRDVVSPLQTFDPFSAVSISRAIERSLGISERPILPSSAADFLATFRK